MADNKITLALPMVEGMFLRKLVYNPEWHKLIKHMLPGIFSVPAHKYICYAMKKLESKGIRITANNIVLYISKETDVSVFRRKLKLPMADPQEIEDILTDMEKDTSAELIDQAYENIIDLAYRRFTKEALSEIAWRMQFMDKGAEIAALCSATARTYHTLTAHKRVLKLAKRTSGISEAAHSINTAGRTIPTFSKGINRYIGGWTRGWANVLMARSGHGKSNFITNEARHKIDKGIVDKVAIISSEEGRDVFWTRMFASVFNLSTSSMRAGIAKATKEQEQELEAMYGDKILFENYVKYKDVVELLFSLRDYELIYIDHINAIEYPGNGNAIANMIGNIPSLISREKEFLKSNPESVIININQVAEKQIEGSIKDYWKMPHHELAYGNSVSWVACREWVTLYYPYKDICNRPNEWVHVDPLQKPTNTDLYVKVEKSSFTDMGEAQLYFDFEHSKMTDATPKGEVKSQITAIQEEMFNEISAKKR